MSEHERERHDGRHANEDPDVEAHRLEETEEPKEEKTSEDADVEAHRHQGRGRHNDR